MFIQLFGGTFSLKMQNLGLAFPVAGHHTKSVCHLDNALVVPNVLSKNSFGDILVIQRAEETVHHDGIQFHQWYLWISLPCR